MKPARPRASTYTTRALNHNIKLRPVVTGAAHAEVEPHTNTATKLRAAPRHWESRLQVSIVRYFAAAVPGAVIGHQLNEAALQLGVLSNLPQTAQAVLFSIPNGDSRDARVQERLKDEGLCPGFPDFAVALHGPRLLIFETKIAADRIRGTRATNPGPRQDLVINILKALGFGVHVVRSVEEFAGVLAANGVKVRHSPFPGLA